MLLIYLVSLFIAPQLWLEPFIGLRVDFYIYPAWFIVILLNGKIYNLFKFNQQDAFFLGMIVWIMISMILNDTHAKSGSILFFYTKIFLLYRIVSVSLSSKEDIKFAINLVIFVVFIVVFEAIDHKYYSPNQLGWAGQSLGWVDPSVLAAGGTGRTRWVAIFDGPGVFCVMFTLILPFLLVRLDDHYKKSTKLLSIILMALVLLAIWSTGSRGGLLATLAILGGYLMTRLNISLFAMIKVAALGALVFTLAPSHLTQTKDSQNSAQNRVVMWAHGLDMVEDNPLFGVGKGNFKRYSGALIAHNSFIDIMGETGFVGVLLWVGLIYFSFKTVYLYMRKETEPIYISTARGISLSLIGYLVSSFFVTLEYETLYFLLAIIRSMGASKNILLQPSLKDFSFIIAIVVTMYMIIKVFVSTLYF
jgi:O-antigen ligase